MESVFARASNLRKDFEDFWKEMCTEADEDKDGRISFDEFEKAMLKLMDSKTSKTQPLSSMKIEEEQK